MGVEDALAFIHDTSWMGMEITLGTQHSTY